MRDLPRGVSLDKSTRGKRRYKARVFVDGKDWFIGRFETAEQAEKACQQAQRALVGAKTTDPKLQFGRIRAAVQQGVNAAACPCSVQAVSPAVPRSSSSCMEAGGRESPAALLGCNGLTAAHFQAVASQGASHQLLQAEVAQEVCGRAATNPMAVLPYISTQGQQLQQQQWLLRASSSSSTGTVQQTAHMQQGDRAAESGSCMSAPPFSMQQERQGGPETGLQALLETALQDAGQLAAHSAHTPAELHEQALQECCSEFLNATASRAPAAVYPPAGKQLHFSTLSGPCGAASAAGRTSFEFSGPLAPEAPGTAGRTSLDRSPLLPAASAVARHSLDASAAPPALSAARRTSFDAPGSLPALSAAAAAARTSFEVSSTSTEVPRAQAGPGNLLLRTPGSMDALLYVSAVMRAVMDLHTVLLHRQFDANVSTDLLQWLSTFRQQQQLSRLTGIAAAVAAGSTEAAADLEVHNTSVMECVSRMVATLTAAGNLTMPGRAYVLGVLQRLNGCLTMLHGVLLQQQQQSSAQPAQQVQCWMQQLQAQASSPEDHLTLQLVALL